MTQKLIKESFTVNDQDLDGKVDTALLGSMLRGLGYAPSQKQVQDMQRVVDSNGSGKFTLSDYQRLIQSGVQERKVPLDELSESFRVFDKDHNGTVSLAELKFMLSTVGETFSEKELELFLKTFKKTVDQDGMVRYDQIVHKLLDQ